MPTRKEMVDYGLKKVPITKLLKKFKNFDFEVALLGYVPDMIDPDGLFFPLLGTGQQFNFSGYSSETMDRLLQQGRSETEIGKRFTVYQDLTQKLYEDCPIGFLGATHGRLLISKKYVLPQVNSLGIFGFQLNNLKVRRITDGK